MPSGGELHRLPWRAGTCPADCACPELSHVLHGVLDSVASGEIPAVSAQERRLVHRVESALAAFEAGWVILGPERGHEPAPE